jgi:hypothetical protein
MSRINFKTLNTEAEFKAAVGSISKRGQSVQLDTHLYLNSVASRFVETGDVRPAVARVNALIADFPKGMRSNAIKAWVEKFLSMSIGPDGVFIAGASKAKDIDLKECANNRWWEFKPEADYVPISDFQKLLAQLVKKGEKDRKECGELSVVDAVKLDALRALAA